MNRATAVCAVAAALLSWVALSTTNVRADDAPKATAESTDGHTPTSTATPTRTPKADGNDDADKKEHETQTASHTPAPALKFTFVEAKGGVTTWRLEPASAGNLVVWDKSADGCTGFNGAVCGGIGSGGNGRFSSGGAGQYLLVTQPYVESGESCKVVHEADFELSGSPETRETVTATYVCSGAPVLGVWWVMAGFTGAVGVAWYVRRVRQ